MNTPHKWQKEIFAFAQGVAVQYRLQGGDGKWCDWVSLDGRHAYFSDNPRSEFRIKPEKKPDVILYGMHNPKQVLEVGQPEAKNSVSFCLTSFKAVGDSVKYTFDGDTGSLKSVEIIK